MVDQRLEVSVQIDFRGDLSKHKTIINELGFYKCKGPGYKDLKNLYFLDCNFVKICLLKRAIVKHLKNWVTMFGDKF